MLSAAETIAHPTSTTADMLAEAKKVDKVHTCVLIAHFLGLPQATLCMYIVFILTFGCYTCLIRRYYIYTSYYTLTMAYCFYCTSPEGECSKYAICHCERVISGFIAKLIVLQMHDITVLDLCKC